MKALALARTARLNVPQPNANITAATFVQRKASMWVPATLAIAAKQGAKHLLTDNLFNAALFAETVS